MGYVSNRQQSDLRVKYQQPKATYGSSTQQENPAPKGKFKFILRYNVRCSTRAPIIFSLKFCHNIMD